MKGVKLSPEEAAYRAMKQRCYNVRHPKYKYYGGRGIIVCERWLESFDNFLEDMGIKPSVDLSLDRLENDLNYCKDNCAWRNSHEQNRNRRSVVNITLNGETKCMREWSRIREIPLNTLIQRMSKGWPPEKVLFQGKFPAGRYCINPIQ